MAKKQTGLGKGLNALISETVPAAGPATVLPIQKIEPNPLQPRKEFDADALQVLADSVSEHGVIQPLTVREGADGYYQIIAGERRWRAARIAGLEEVPVHIIEADDRTVMELALVENLQREDLNPMEEANGYASLQRDYGLTQEQISDTVGKSRPAVANALRLLALDEDTAELVRLGSISPGHARALLTLKTDRQRKEACRKILALQLSVRQTEALCKNMLKPAPEETPAAAGADYIGDCERELTRQMGRKVRIVTGKRKGHFELDFYGMDDLNRLFQALQQIKIKKDKA